MSFLLTPIKGPMATQRQIEANKRNAQKSTGPRTDEGKKKVALNALKHGLLARHVVLPNEDEREFSEFRRRLNNELRTDGELEELLVETVAACAWRLRRIVRIEKGLFIAYVCEKARPKGQRETRKARENETVTLAFDMKQDFAAERARADEAEVLRGGTAVSWWPHRDWCTIRRDYVKSFLGANLLAAYQVATGSRDWRAP
jgi:hypothetical protein